MRAKQISIYKTTYELSHEVLQATRNFPRDLKATLGQRMIDVTINMIINIYRANAARSGRAEIVQQVLEEVEVIEMAIRLSKDQREITPEKQGDMIQLTDSIGRQAYRWMQSAQRQQNPNRQNVRGQNV